MFEQFNALVFNIIEIPFTFLFAITLDNIV